jgi:protein gp37
MNYTKIEWTERTWNPTNPDWARDLRDQCAAANVPFFFKQWGGTNKKKAGRLLDRRIHNGYPLIHKLTQNPNG